MSSAPKTIAILGATGTQGASVLDTFLASPNWYIRALTRNPASTRAQSIPKSSRITVVRADSNDPDSLLAAFKGCTAIFAVTDYWAPFLDPTLRAKHAIGPTPGEALRKWAYDDEIRHGRNIVDAAATVVGLTHFIWSGLPSPKKYSKGKYSRIYHFDSKAVVTEYVRREQPELAKRMSVLYVGFYASNMLVSGLMIPNKQSDGTFLVQRICNGDAKHPFIITRNDTGPLVKALVDVEPGKTLLGYTAMLSWAAMTEMWAEATGQTAVFQEVSLADFKRQFPVEGEELLSAPYSAEFGYAGGDKDVIEPPDLGIPDRPEAIRAWMKEQDSSGILNPKPQKL